MSNPVGRPGKNRVKEGKIRAQVIPALKTEGEEIAHADSRLRSLSQMVEAALAYYIRDYKAASGSLDANNFPLLSSPTAHAPGVASHDAHPLRKARPK